MSGAAARRGRHLLAIPNLSAGSCARGGSGRWPAIHGEAQRLPRCMSAWPSGFNPGDRLVYLGDYHRLWPGLGAGALDARPGIPPRRPGAADAFLGDIVLLRGSQEEMWQKLLELQFAPNPREVLAWMLEHGVAATLASYGVDARHGVAACRDGVLAITRWTATVCARRSTAHPGHRQLLTALRRAAFTDDGALLFVNAGVDPGKPLDLQRDVFWWGGGDILDARCALRRLSPRRLRLSPPPRRRCRDDLCRLARCAAAASAAR